MHVCSSFEALLNKLTEQRIQAMASIIKDVGFVCLEGVFSQANVNEARHQVQKLVDAANGEYAGSQGGEGLTGAILQELASSEAFLRLCRKLCGHQGITPREGAPVKQILRCLSGSSGFEHCYYFHYDSYELTALVPIMIPTEGRTGDLIIIPNARPRRRSYVLNAIDKAFLERVGGQASARRRASRSDVALRVKLEPGNLYFFNGNRSLHANEDTDPKTIRATLLIHFAETHHDHWLRKIRAESRRRATA